MFMDLLAVTDEVPVAVHVPTLPVVDPVVEVEFEVILALVEAFSNIFDNATNAKYC